MERLQTAESVAVGHPDKLCDQISDAVLDAHLASDPFARVACETAISGTRVWVFGEVTSDADPDEEQIARGVLRDAGYRIEADGIDPDNCQVSVTLRRQSPDIARGVDFDGAGDQGIIYGYATDESGATYLPLPVVYAHELTKALRDWRTSDFPELRPDGKAQVTMRYTETGRTRGITALVLSAQHAGEANARAVQAELRRRAFEFIELRGQSADGVDIYVNPTGAFSVGGPAADAGLTGRKIAVDSYGGIGRHGGGAFSGKDGTKVDRSAAYAARHAAKNIVAAGLARRAEVALAYAIGVAHPVAITVDTYGTGTRPEPAIAQAVAATFDFSPRGMIERLDLRSPRFRRTATFGHFTDQAQPWEQTDQAAELREAVERA
jgi:S-adenosylmethionine synthetase